MLKTLLKWITGGALDRALGSVDKYIAAQTDREKIKAEILREHIRTRGDWLRAGGFWLVLLGGLPFVFHAAVVNIYSVFWCKLCAYPKLWSIAALPPPFDEYQWVVILTWMGALSVMGSIKKK